jgi:hypothetical protein
MKDNIRPKGTVEVKCQRCGWHFWLDCLSKLLPGGPFICPGCQDKGTDQTFLPKAMA